MCNKEPQPNSGPGHSTPGDSRANHGAGHNTNTYPDGYRVCRSANCYADADANSYPDRYFLTFHCELLENYGVIPGQGRAVNYEVEFLAVCQPSSHFQFGQRYASSPAVPLTGFAG